MALEKPYSDQFGVDHPQGYWRLTGFSYDNYQQTADLTFSCYATKDAALAKMQPLAVKSVHLTDADYAMVNDLLTQSFKAQAYEFAKARPEGDAQPFFADAKDV